MTTIILIGMAGLLVVLLLLVLATKAKGGAQEPNDVGDGE